jgi:formamidopyrimidine-DNA glycosylase
MPELPEVEITRRGIAPQIVGHRLTSVAARIPALRYPLPTSLAQLLTGKTLHAISRRGKYLLFDFGDGHVLLHLGMSGSLRIVTASTEVQKHDHVDLVFDTTVLRLRDPRRFGALLWLTGDPQVHPLIASLGVEPLSDAFSATHLHTRLAGRSVAIKQALMDSHIVVGVGNIYASESLFRAAIDPRTPAGKVSLKRLERLVPAIRATLQAAIEAGGSSLRDFIHSDGSSGYFQQQYAVYGRTDEPCHACGKPIRLLRQGGRASFYCPRCQR